MIGYWVFRSQIIEVDYEKKSSYDDYRYILDVSLFERIKFIHIITDLVVNKKEVIGYNTVLDWVEAMAGSEIKFRKDSFFETKDEAEKVMKNKVIRCVIE